MGNREKAIDKVEGEGGIGVRKKIHAYCLDDCQIENNINELHYL